MPPGSSRGEWVSDSGRPRFFLAPRSCSRGGGGGVRTEPRLEERRSLRGGPYLHDTRRGRPVPTGGVLIRSRLCPSEKQSFLLSVPHMLQDTAESLPSPTRLPELTYSHCAGSLAEGRWGGVFCPRALAAATAATASREGRDLGVAFQAPPGVPCILHWQVGY